MGGILSSLFGKKEKQQPATSLRINTSLQGVPIAITLGGANRLAGNVIDYYGLFSVNAAPGASKGGVFGGGGGKGGGQYNYYVNLLLSWCEGPIAGVTQMWQNGTLINFPHTANGEQTVAFNGTNYTAELFAGDYTQLPWGYTEARQPSRAFNYRGLAYGGYGNFPLGGSAALPNITAEILSTNNGAIPGQPDGDMSVALSAFLTNQYWGLLFPSQRLGSLSIWQSYTLALGLVGSPVLASAVSASALISNMMTGTASEACWQDGLLTVIPRGDQPISIGQVSQIVETHQVPTGPINKTNGYQYPQIKVGNAGSFVSDGGVTYQNGGPLTEVQTYAPSGLPTFGSPGPGQYYESAGVYYFNVSDIGNTVLITYDWAATAAYTPDTRSLYDFSIDDFLKNSATIGQGIIDDNSPLIVTRKPRDLMLNNIQVSYLDRSNNYNPVLIEMKDEASITAFKRERPSGVKTFDFWCLGSAAQQSATLQLIQEQNPRTFQFTVGRHFMIIMQLMGLYTVTDPGQGLFRQAVRLLEVQEQDDFTLTWTCEEFLGTLSAPVYGTEVMTPYPINDNQDPGGVNPPLIFEPTDELGGGLQIWAAVSGINTSVWGGCYVWVSYDGTNYSKIPTPIVGGARMGVLSADLPVFAANPVGITVDQVNTLSVNIAESGGSLATANVQSAIGLATSCYVGGEIIAYANAALTGANAYDLTYLVRGAYGTEAEIVDHPAGTPFARLDNSILQLPYDQSQIGITVYFKFQSFNQFDGGLQQLSECPAYPYTITGSALVSPLPNVQNLRVVYDQQTGFTELDWDEVTDFRLPKYEIRSGTTATSASTLGTVAHPPFRVPGDGTFLVSAVAQPVSGIGNVYSETWESVTISGALITQNVVLTVDLKALNWPGTFTGGAGIDGGLNAIRTGGGNILTDPNILSTTDIINYGAGTALSGTYYASAAATLDIGYVANAAVAIQYLPTGVPIGQNVLSIGSILTTPDILGSASTQYINNYPIINTAVAAGPAWRGWQAFSPGTYQTRFLEFGFFLSTIDPNTISYNLAMTITVTIPARVDTYASASSSSADVTITFQPTGAASTAAFNGGAGPSSLPAITWGIINAQAGDDFIITGLSLSALTYKVLNGGVRVVRSLNIFAEGY